MTLKYGYVTNGFRDHALDDVFALLADLGYDGVGITLDVGHLHPFQVDINLCMHFRGSPSLFTYIELWK